MGNVLITRKGGRKNIWFVNLTKSNFTDVVSEVIDTKTSSEKKYSIFGEAHKWNSNRWMNVDFQGSNDGSTWVKIKSVSNGTDKSSIYGGNNLFTSTGTVNYRWLRLQSTVQADNSGAAGVTATLIVEE